MATTIPSAHRSSPAYVSRRHAIDDGVAVGMTRRRGTEHRADISRALGETGERAAEVGFGGQTARVPGAPARPVHEVLPHTSDQAVRAYGTVWGAHFGGVGRTCVAAEPAGQDAFRDGRKPKHRKGHVEMGIDGFPSGSAAIVGDVACLIGDAVLGWQPHDAVADRLRNLEAGDVVAEITQWMAEG